MRLVALTLALICFTSLVSAHSTVTDNWEKDLENGYISTAPLVTEHLVIVRTSGTWTGTGSPHVFAFDYSGEPVWQIENAHGLHHDLSPLLLVENGQGCGGNWTEMVIVAWADGKVQALDVATGTEQWSAQTEVDKWGITGSLALDGDLVVVPTRQGLSTYCLADGTLQQRVELNQLGWRNGVTVSNDAYLLGNEEGVLNTIYRNGTVISESIGDGKIRHAPLLTNAGLLIHLQTKSASEIFIDGELFLTAGPSPAMPVIHNNQVYLATSDDFIFLDCSLECENVGIIPFHSNGEIAIQELDDGEWKVWAPQNNPEGGWGVFTTTEDWMILQSPNDDYATAAPGFGSDGTYVLGNDKGILMFYTSQQNNSVIPQAHEDLDYIFIMTTLILLISILASTPAFILHLHQKVLKSLLPGVVIFMAFNITMISTAWSGYLSEQIEPEGDWDESWPEEWKDTQVVVFELPDGEVVFGGLSGHNTVENLTDDAAFRVGIIIEKETFDIGEWVKSIDGHEGAGWEFRIDGERGLVGISEAQISSNSVIRWQPA
jgi:outer membrane protein assembly factor BamB